MSIHVAQRIYRQANVTILYARVALLSSDAQAANTRNTAIKRAKEPIGKRTKRYVQEKRLQLMLRQTRQQGTLVLQTCRKLKQAWQERTCPIRVVCVAQRGDCPVAVALGTAAKHAKAMLGKITRSSVLAAGETLSLRTPTAPLAPKEGNRTQIQPILPYFVHNSD